MNDREAGSNLGTRCSLKAMIDLVLQQLCRLIEQVDGNEPVGKAPDHLVTSPPNRREFAKVIKQTERVDRGQTISLVA